MAAPIFLASDLRSRIRGAGFRHQWKL